MARSLVRWTFTIVLMLSCVLAAISAWVWLVGELHAVNTDALRETRTYRVFNPGPSGTVVYALDGQSLRNGLSSAVILTIAAFSKGQDAPKVIAVYSTANRDRDFRPPSSTPTYWRPSIEGRSPTFHRFLIEELIPQIEQQTPERRFLLGHSLAGLYALDLATRQPTRFAGVFAFAPTFSHDTSIAERLPMVCGEGRLLYANWGLESARDTKVFDDAATKWAKAEPCKADPPVISRHYGSIHQTIMMTGQVHAAFGWMD